MRKREGELLPWSQTISTHVFTSRVIINPFLTSFTIPIPHSVSLHSPKLDKSSPLCPFITRDKLEFLKRTLLRTKGRQKVIDKNMANGKTYHYSF